MHIDGRVKNYFVTGCPLGHTLSPEIYNTIFECMEETAVYTAFQIAPGKVSEISKAVRNLGFAGFNVTIPHKTAIMDYLDEISETANVYDAVNTVKNIDGKLHGFNTDGEGFKRLLLHNDIDVNGKRCFVIGAGGAANAIVFELAKMGAEKIYIKDQDLDKAEKLARRVNLVFPKSAKNTDEIKDKAQIIINASPVGMKGMENKSPIEDLEVLSDGKTICDIVYNPRQTKLMLDGARRGYKTIGGIGMLIYQAIAASEIYLEKEIPQEITDKLFKRLSFDKNIVLTGFMGTGKTTVAKELANRMSLTYIDTDELIEKTAQMSIEDIFAKKGEQYFRDLEHGMICSVKDMKGAIISVGGGVVLRKENIKVLRQSSVIVRLAADFDFILKNIVGTNRPIIRQKSKEEILEILKNREESYKNCDIEIDRTNMKASELADVILKKYWELI